VWHLQNGSYRWWGWHWCWESPLMSGGAVVSCGHMLEDICPTLYFFSHFYLTLPLSICIPHSLCRYLTTLVPHQPPSNPQHSPLIYWSSTLWSSLSLVTSTPCKYHCPHWDRTMWPYGTFWWSADLHVWKALY
jgi:hypothetical protein